MPVWSVEDYLTNHAEEACGKNATLKTLTIEDFGSQFLIDAAIKIAQERHRNPEQVIDLGPALFTLFEMAHKVDQGIGQITHSERMQKIYRHNARQIEMAKQQAEEEEERNRKPVVILVEDGRMFQDAPTNDLGIDGREMKRIEEKLNYYDYNVDSGSNNQGASLVTFVMTVAFSFYLL